MPMIKREKVMIDLNDKDTRLNIFFIIFIIPIGLVYFLGWNKGLIVFFTILVVAGVIPLMINILINYFYNKQKIRRIFFTLLIFFIFWCIMIVLYKNFNYLVYAIFSGISFGLILRLFNKILKNK
jgi:uncharacterized membrane protein